MGTYKIHISGIVQGVGFRPLVYNLAKSLKIQGTVSNTNQGVIINCTTCPTCVETFVELIKNHPPEQAKITRSSIIETEEQTFSGFQIIPSQNKESGNLLVTPDYAICTDCLAELNDPNHRRFEYPFITCTNCGPRYSIIQNLPYDRQLTTMHSFSMCQTCEDEYLNPRDRRFYSQTNSCSDCGITLQLFDTKNTKEQIDIGNEITATVNALKQGKIIAVKGIGGYLIMADATNRKSIQELRSRKNRPTKPFAIMVGDENALSNICQPTPTELKEWNSTVAPIVLFNLKKETSLPTNAIAPGLNQMGIMKAYTPLHVLICQKFNNPLIATSANLTDSPIIYTDDNAKENLPRIADLILSNNREIVIPQDDSVLRFTQENQKIIIRRSRGLAPNYISSNSNFPSNTLAVGAMLKSAFALTQNGNIFISQYLGATNSYETQLAFTKVYSHLASTLQFQPSVLISDKHPGYFTSEWAEELAIKNNIPLHQVQHHEAHFCAVLGENDLWNKKVLGFIWDGTGLGNDDQIWGGETLVFDHNKINREDHLPYHKHILGDKMVNEPRISALSFFGAFKDAKSLLENKFTPNEWKAYNNQITHSNLKTSSMGRLFDAVASILNLRNKSSYHGEAAMLLEALAETASHTKNIKPYALFENNTSQIGNILHGILADLEVGTPPNVIALKFHKSLVEIILQTAHPLKIDDIAFSGGVFQNKLLVDLIIQNMGCKYQLHFHKQLSPNDECIAYGQLMHYHIIHENQ